MDVLIALLFAIFAFVVGVAGNLIANEIYDRAPSIAIWLVDRAASRLPDSERVRYSEEWRAHLEECPGKLGQLCHAISCLLGAHALAEELCAPNPEGAKASMPSKHHLTRQHAPKASIRYRYFLGFLVAIASGISTHLVFDKIQGYWTHGYDSSWDTGSVVQWDNYSTGVQWDNYSSGAR